MGVARWIGVVGVLVLPACQTNGVLGDPCASNNSCPDDTGTTGGDDDAMTSAGPGTPQPDSGEPPNPTAGPSTTSPATDDGPPDPPGPLTCVFNCATDEDCIVNGMDFGLKCSPILDVCFQPCDDDLVCWAQASGWTLKSCVSDDECPQGPCVDYMGGESGGCAIDADTQECPMYMTSLVSVFDVAGYEVVVCANVALSCQDYHGEQTCMSVSELPTSTCDDLMCPDPLTCDDAEPECNCETVDDCIAAGYGPSPFSGAEVDCRAL